MTDKRDLGTEGVKDQLKGAAKQGEGRVRGTVGAATGDTSEQRNFGETEQDLDSDPKSEE
jgi:uncharacterized protein YjbJ (UPF0337 family)